MTSVASAATSRTSDTAALVADYQPDDHDVEATGRRGGVVASAEKNLEQFLVDARSYVANETDIQAEEWRFVDRCNGALRARYAKLRQQTDVVVQAVTTSQQTLGRLPEFFGKIDELMRSVEALELVAAGLDTYSLVLESKFAPAAGGSPAAAAVINTPNPNSMSEAATTTGN